MMDKLEEKIVEIIRDNEGIKQYEISNILFNQYQIELGTRMIREHIRAINQRFIDGETDYVIVSDSAGMYVSQDNNEIRKYNNNKKKLAYSLLKAAYRTDKKLNENLNLSFNKYIEQSIREELSNELSSI